MSNVNCPIMQNNHNPTQTYCPIIYARNPDLYSTSLSASSQLPSHSFWKLILKILPFFSGFNSFSNFNIRFCLAFIVATKNLELHIQNLLALNPKMQFVIYTLELDILSGIKDIFERNKIHNMEVLQISVSKLDSKNVFVTQPSPWLITGEA